MDESDLDIEVTDLSSDPWQSLEGHDGPKQNKDSLEDSGEASIPEALILGDSDEEGGDIGSTGEVSIPEEAPSIQQKKESKNSQLVSSVRKDPLLKSYSLPGFNQKKFQNSIKTKSVLQIIFSLLFLYSLKVGMDLFMSF